MTYQNFSGLPFSFLPFFIKNYLVKHSQASTFIVLPNEKHCVNVKNILKSFNLNCYIDHFPSWDCLPYDRVSPARDISAQRTKVLSNLIHLNSNVQKCIIASPMALIQKLPPKNHFLNKRLTLKKNQGFSFEKLKKELAFLGYIRCDSVCEQGDFSIRGSIIDFFSSAHTNPIRVDFFGDHIETIKNFNSNTQKTISHLNEVTINPFSEIIIGKENKTLFQQKFRELFYSSRKEEIYNHPLYCAIGEGISHVGYEHFLPLFFNETDTLLDYTHFSNVYIHEQSLLAAQENLDSITNYYKARLLASSHDTSYYFLPPNELYNNFSFLESLKEQQTTHVIYNFEVPKTNNLNIKSISDYSLFNKKENHESLSKQLKNFIETSLKNKKKVIFLAPSNIMLQRWQELLKHLECNVYECETWPTEDKNIKIFLTQFPLDHGFESPHEVVITDQDFFGKKHNTQKPKKLKPTRFFQELSNLSIHDIVVHREHGIGRYEGLETLNINNVAHDCLKIVYQDNEKLLLPVENIEVISRYGSDYSTIQLDKLGSSAWQNRKSKVKKKLAIIADYLLKIAAERSLYQSSSLNISKQQYDAFCNGFPFTETDDQLYAINEVIQDISSTKPMDRLICGDVGFGKTEVAMRSAFVAAQNNKQVAIITPTSLLCRQHFHNLKERFRDFPFKVVQLSRLLSSKESKIVKENIANGSVDVVVGTHALLSNQIHFKDLGLLIVDEEQHFGVSQKEKLKTFKSSVHVLTMTATPIPRTLQLALTGVRDLSLITTPPIDRLAVRTFVMPYDTIIIREAILREFNRGGQIFFVSPRVSKLEKLYNELTQLIPEIKIVVAHGQMPVKNLEEAMCAFYEKKYDLLLSTNIIESGIDIPTANTIIIHQCEFFGLSQLYQLRGRVGRSKMQGYAYLTYKGKQVLSEASKKRLQVMQNIDSLGAGFTIANHDMDIRGAGNIVGEEQSGHIREVGAELYQTLLQEAIIMARAHEKNQNKKTDLHHQEEWSPQINIGIPILIPEIYISDLDLRLGLYKRIANVKNENELKDIQDEFIDRFGPIPHEVKNLFNVIIFKNLCKTAYVEKLDVGPKGILIAFKSDSFPKPNELIEYLQLPQVQKEWTIKIRPDQKLVLSKAWKSHTQRMQDIHRLLLDFNKLV